MTVRKKTNSIAAGSSGSSPSESAVATPEVEARATLKRPPKEIGRTRSRASTSSSGEHEMTLDTPEAFAELLASDFSANGWKVIEELRESKPLDYAKLCASVLPKLRKTEAAKQSSQEELASLSDEALLERIEELDKEIAAIRKRRQTRKKKTKVTRKVKRTTTKSKAP